LAPAGSSAIPNGRSAVFLRRRSRPINPSALATELDRRITDDLKAIAGSIGPLGGAVDRLNDIHRIFKAQLASGQFTDEQYAAKGRELLSILGDFEGLIADLT